MTLSRMTSPGPAWTALTPDCRQSASQYEACLRAMSCAQLLSEYESVTYEFYAAEKSLAWLQVVECRREIGRRMQQELAA